MGLEKLSCARAGFSLLELLAVVSLTAILSVVAMQVLLNGQLRSSQIEALNRMRREGDFVLEQLSATIRNARSVACVDGDASRLLVTGKNGESITFAFSGTMIASNSATLSSSSVEVSDGSFACIAGTGGSGTRVAVEFTLSTPESEQVSALSQAFATSVYVRTQ